MKRCNKCNEDKEYTEFYKHNTSRDGYGIYCKQCSSKNFKKLYQIDEFKERVLDRSKKNYKINKDRYIQNSNRWLHEKKDGFYYVYLLPDYNYVGYTCNLYRRLNEHKHIMKRNTENYQVLAKCASESDALVIEAKYHADGYAGDARIRNKNKQCQN